MVYEDLKLKAGFQWQGKEIAQTKLCGPRSSDLSHFIALHDFSKKL